MTGHGEYMRIDWQGEVTAVVRGHVTETEFFSALDAAGWDDEREKLSGPVHAFARYMPDPSGEYHVLLEWSAPGRGAFPVTVASELAELYAARGKNK